MDQPSYTIRSISPAFVRRKDDAIPSACDPLQSWNGELGCGRDHNPLGGDMAKIADGKAETYSITLRGEGCEVTVHQSSQSVFVAHGSYKGRAIEGSGRTLQSALNRWHHLADRSED